MTAPALTRDAVSAAAAYADTWIALRRRTGRVPGVQVAVRLGGELLLSGAHGHADVESGVELTPRHRFRIASHSKTFTASAVLRLVDAGRLRLDDPLGPLVPWVAEADATLATATVRELLGHAAGVTRDGTAGDFWQLQGEFLDTDGLRAAVAAGGSLIGRSERFKYSNIGYSLLGAVVEAVTGQSYADHVRTTLLEPLGLDRTTPDLDGAVDLVTGYTSLSSADARVPLRHSHTRAMAAATGFCGTAEDLTSWFSAHTTGRTDVLSAHSQRLAQRTEWTTEGGDVTYGLGFIGQRCGSRSLVGHSGGFPGHITKSVLDPAAGLAVSVLTNCVDGPASDLALGVVKLVDLFASEWTPPGEGHHEGVDLDAFCGRWANLWGVMDVVRAGGTLIALDPDVSDPSTSQTRLQAVDATTLRVTRDGGFGDYAETWSLGHLPDGTPTLREHSGATSVPLSAYSPPGAG